MFTKNSVSQSMISAVESVLAEDKKFLLEPENKKETPPFDGPYKKPDTKPGHGDASRVKHLAKMAIPKDVKEELKGNQVKLDKNHNGKLDSQDFKLLRMKKEEVEELDELSKSTLGSYAKKASRDAVITRKLGADFENRANRAKSPGMKDANTELSSKYKQMSWKRRDGLEKAVDRLTKEDIGAMQSVVGENKGKKTVRVDTLKGPTLSNDPEVKIANAHFSGKSATLKAEGKGTDTAVPFVTDSVSPTQREINKAVKPTFKKIKEMLGKTGTGESELPASAQLPG